ncbi:hypothetical protein [Halomarina oriensis]|uniref:Uncharacterized protein n=1 Tax=Halomarina oriensis TaxID=671145 RepID=A0A6B0GR40_9EURY|nr:hypothetical protein [Halomarina oriensis]MWG34118.1 hypothetical protein [Halomarina oriensis]
MHRRRFLVAAGSATVLPFAGCVTSATTESLGPPDETTSYEYNHSYRYRVGTPERVTLDVEFGREDGLLSLKTVLTAHDVLRHDEYRIEVDTDPSTRPGGASAQVWTTGALVGGTTIEQSFFSGATVTVDGYDDQSGGIALPLRIDRENTGDDVRLDVSATFGTGDTLETTYELTHEETYAVPTPATD